MTEKVDKRREWYLKNREHVNAMKRAWRKAHNNSDTHKYEKTPKGFLMRVYRNMESRVTGVQWSKFHLYHDLTLLSREQFYEWAWNDKTFWKLLETWQNSNWDRKLTPSVDRIDSTKGYSIDNMEWVTHSENSRRGAVSKRRYSLNSHESVRGEQK